MSFNLVNRSKLWLVSKQENDLNREVTCMVQTLDLTIELINYIY